MGAAGLVRDIVEAGLASRRLENTLRAATGSVQSAGEAYAFMRQEANRLEPDLQTAATQFGKLSAATQGTIVQGQATRDLFKAMAEALVGFGLSQEKVAGVTKALTDIVSKNTVAMEELRGQFGDRLPGALRRVAQEMGITTATLVQVVSEGQVVAEDFVPAVTRRFQTMGKEAPTAVAQAQAALAPLGNAWFELKDSIARSGVLDAIAAIAEGLASVINRFQIFEERVAKAPSMRQRQMLRELERVGQEAAQIQAQLSGEIPLPLPSQRPALERQLVAMQEQARKLAEELGRVNGEIGRLREAEKITPDQGIDPKKLAEGAAIAAERARAEQGALQVSLQRQQELVRASFICRA
jgi:tape measure domain-containing protein